MGQRATLTNTDDSEVFGSSRASYALATASFTLAATATDIFYIAGAAGKVVKVWKMGISASKTTAGVDRIFIIKRSTANSGGTAVATTMVPMDSRDPAASFLAQHYTANPTPGTTIGNLRVFLLNVPAGATAGIGGLVGAEMDFHSFFGKPITLLSAAEGVAINLNGVTLTGGAVQCWAQVTEE